jgi:hypothetical protein
MSLPAWCPSASASPSQANRELEALIEEARRAAPVTAAASAATAAAASSSGDGRASLGSPPPDDLTSMERLLMIAERCLDEDVASFRDSIQAIVDQVEVRALALKGLPRALC